MGNEEYAKVRAANEQASRVLLLILLGCAVNGVIFFAEQPISTLLPQHGRWKVFQELLSDHLHTASMWMQAYGGDTPKRTWLISNTSEVNVICNKPVSADAEVKIKSYDTVTHPTGTVSITATKNLKGTEAYPLEFGRAVAVAFSSVRQSWPDEGVGLGNISNLGCSDEQWEEANLDSVIADLRELRKSQCQR